MTEERLDELAHQLAEATGRSVGEARAAIEPLRRQAEPPPVIPGQITVDEALVEGFDPWGAG